eukprot:PhM_4_TR3819/c0_g1_i2/m.91979
MKRKTPKKEDNLVSTTLSRLDEELGHMHYPMMHRQQQQQQQQAIPVPAPAPHPAPPPPTPTAAKVLLLDEYSPLTSPTNNNNKTCRALAATSFGSWSATMFRLQVARQYYHTWRHWRAHLQSRRKAAHAMYLHLQQRRRAHIFAVWMQWACCSRRQKKEDTLHVQRTYMHLWMSWSYNRAIRQPQKSANLLVVDNDTHHIASTYYTKWLNYTKQLRIHRLAARNIVNLTQMHVRQLRLRTFHTWMVCIATRRFQESQAMLLRIHELNRRKHTALIRRNQQLDKCTQQRTITQVRAVCMHQWMRWATKQHSTTHHETILTTPSNNTHTIRQSLHHSAAANLLRRTGEQGTLRQYYATWSSFIEARRVRRVKNIAAVQFLARLGASGTLRAAIRKWSAFVDLRRQQRHRINMAATILASSDRGLQRVYLQKLARFVQQHR